MRIDTISFADAYCRKDGMAAVAASRKLVIANPTHPRALLNYGLSLDLAGRGIAAYRLLAPLGKAGHTMPTAVRCGDDFIYSGTVAEVAQRRLFVIKSSLTALGMTMPLSSPAETKAGSNTIYRLTALVLSRRQMDANKEKIALKMAKMRFRSQKWRRCPNNPGKFAIFSPGSYKSIPNLDRVCRNLQKSFQRPSAPSRNPFRKSILGGKKAAT